MPNLIEATQGADPNCPKCQGCGIVGLSNNLADTMIARVCDCEDPSRKAQRRVAELFEREQVTDWDLF